MVCVDPSTIGYSNIVIFIIPLAVLVDPSLDDLNAIEISDHVSLITPVMNKEAFLCIAAKQRVGHVELLVANSPLLPQTRKAPLHSLG